MERILVDNQEYAFAGLHINKRGVELVSWETGCRACGSLFVVEIKPGKTPQIRRCPAHRRRPKILKMEN